MSGALAPGGSHPHSKAVPLAALLMVGVVAVAATRSHGPALHLRISAGTASRLVTSSSSASAFLLRPPATPRPTAAPTELLLPMGVVRQQRAAATPAPAAAASAPLGVWLQLACWGVLAGLAASCRFTGPNPRWPSKGHTLWAAAAVGGRPDQAYATELTAAITAVVAAANAARRVAPSPTNEMQKSDLSPVTVADFAVQAIVLRSLRQVFPEDRICAEETAEALKEDKPLLAKVVETVRTVVPTATPEEVCEWIDYGGFRGSGGRYWTLDPVDGTKGFLRGEQYAVCLALLEDGVVRVGVQGCPNLPTQPGSYEDPQWDGTPGALFYAIAGQGAFSEPMPAPGTAAHSAAPRPPQRLTLPAHFALAPAALRFCESVEAGHSSHDDAAKVAKVLGIERPSLRMDSQAKYCCMARGDAQVLLRLPGGLTAGTYRENIWDQASGSLILQEAGGAVSDQYGRPLDFTAGYKLFNNKGVIAAAHPDLLQRVVAAVGAVLQAEPVA
eukprot:EG_transcript_8518